MIQPRELLESVGDIWLVWLLSGSLLGLLGARLLGPRGIRAGSWRTLLAGEAGATYSLVYVLVFPIFLLLVCLVVETTLILTVKTGTVYAAYAAARSEAVWVSARPDRSRERRQAAAVGALAPFAAAGGLYASGAGVAGTPSIKATVYAQAYAEVAHGQAAPSYVMAKYRFAERATTVADTPAEAGDVAVRVTYEMPLHVPGVGRILGARASWPGARFFTRKIQSTAVLPDERPRNPTQTLGIGYESE